MSDSKKPSQEKFDAEFDAFLRDENSRLAELYRKLPHPEPDASLDAHIRAQARRALFDREETATETHPSPKSLQRARRWLPALGVAATLVLAVGLAWRLAPWKATTREAASVAAVADGVPAQSQPASAPAPASKASSAPSEESARQQASADVPAPIPAPVPTYRHKLRPVITQETTPVPAQNVPKVDAKSVVSGSITAKAAAPALVAPVEEVKSAAPPMSLPSAEPSAASERKMAKSLPAPAPPAAPQRDAIENRAAAAQAFSTADASNGPPVAIEQDPSDPTRYHWAIPHDAATATSASGGIYPPDPPPLQAWVQIIHSMMNDGHLDAAKRALAELRARYPDYRVPADLRDLQ